MEEASSNKKNRISRVYRLTEPYRLKEVKIEQQLNPGEVMIQPQFGSICHADLRYYTGNRRSESLKKKLPMALIHEGMGEVVESKAEEFNIGQKVVIVPNIPDYDVTDQTFRDELLQRDPIIEDNYSREGRFLGSGTDGIAQSRLILPAYCVVAIPAEVPHEIAVLTELSTISHQALRNIKPILNHSKIAIFGDGPVGFVTAALIHHHYGIGPEQLRVFGVVPNKLKQFDFASTSFVNDPHFTKDYAETIDIAIECAGGKFSSKAINQAISVLKPGGHLILLGVTEELVPINTRDILEKGITVSGSSRSSFHDFHAVIKAMKNRDYRETLRRLLPERYHNVHSVEDFAQAMQYASENPHWKKIILNFKW